MSKKLERDYKCGNGHTFSALAHSKHDYLPPLHCPECGNKSIAEEMTEPTVETPVYRKVLYKGPPEHATPLYLINCNEGWRESIVCTGMYEWTADWLLEQIQGKPFAPQHRPDHRAA